MGIVMFVLAAGGDPDEFPDVPQIRIGNWKIEDQLPRKEREIDGWHSHEEACNIFVDCNIRIIGIKHLE